MPVYTGLKDRDRAGLTGSALWSSTGRRCLDDPNLTSDGMGFEILASSLRADLTDTKAFLGALAEKLGGALPTLVHVERKGGLFAKEKPVNRVSIELGEHRYAIENARHGGLTASRAKVVRGIALKTDELPVDAWIEDLSRDLAVYAARNTQARMALERLLT
jgi:hypothetical protein